jgi:signal transduction histidine kinase/ligand-binding sensor domain-containing protein
MRRPHIAFGCGLLLFVPLLPIAAQQYSFQYFGADQGLTNMAVRTLFQDRLGYLWISTEGGTFRYDGTRFRHFTAKDGLPFQMQAAYADGPDGSVLVTGQAGIFRFWNDRFEKQTLPGNPDFQSLTSLRNDHRGNVYFGSLRGLLVGSRSPAGAIEWKLIKNPPATDDTSVNALIVDSDAVWYQCGLHLCRLDQSGVPVLAAATPMGAPAFDGAVDGEGNIWYRLIHNQILLLRHGGRRMERWDVQLPTLNGPLQTDAGGRLVIPTAEGLVIKSAQGLHLVGRKSGLTPPASCFLQDREGSVWIGLSGRGLVRWSGYGAWDAFGAATGLDDEVPYSILPVSGGVLVGGETGLYRGREVDGAWNWQAVPGFHGVRIRTLKASRDGGVMVLGEHSGFARITPDGRASAWRHTATVSSSYSDFIEAADGTIWLGTSVGLFRKSAGQNGFIHVPGAPEIRVWQIVQTQDKTIYAAGSAGLVRVSPNGQVRTFTTADGLADKWLLSLAIAPDGELWAGYRSRGTVEQIRVEGDRLKVIHHDRDLPIPPAITYFLGFDRDGRLWAGTDQGVQRWDGKQWTRYTREDGLVWNDCNLHAFAQGPDGAIWIGTSAGLARFRPEHEQPPPAKPPPPVLSDITLGSARVAALESPSVPYAANSLFVAYSALTFSRDKSVLFRHRLLPLFDGLRETTSRELSFPGLRPGSYRFELLARDGWGRWSTTPAVFAFEVRPPWWLNGWAKAVYILLAGVAVAALLWWWSKVHQRQLEAQREQQEKDRIVAEAQAQLETFSHLSRVTEVSEMAAGLAHEIWQPLSAIALNASSAIKLLELPEPDLDEARQAMGDIAQDQRRAIDIIEQLRRGLKSGSRQARRVDLNAAAKAAAAFAQRYSAAQNAAVLLELAPSVPPVLGNETQLQQAIQNLIRNGLEATAAFPEGARVVTVQTSPAAGGRMVVVEVQDSGPGVPEDLKSRIFDPQFSTKAEGLGLGLTIVKSIVGMHGGRISVENAPQAGAVFRIELPAAPPAAG